jgi:tRNA dimethylallyltransferase
VPGISFKCKEIEILLGKIKSPLEESRPFVEGMPKKRVIVIAGPTACGKTELSLKLAKLLGGEVVSADSMQVYRKMDIGTAKATPAQRALIPHHLIDICDIDDPYTVYRYAADASAAIYSIAARNKVPIVVGGSGFYLHALMFGAPKGPPSDPILRASLEAELDLMGPEFLYSRLQEQDPQYAAKITKADRQKIVRALEIIALTQKKVSSFAWSKQPLATRPGFDFRCFFLHRPKEYLYERIEKRCEQMLAHGLLQEVRELQALGLEDNASACEAIGYRQVLAYFNTQQSRLDYEALLTEFKKASRHYAKRQFTWFRKEPAFRWIDMNLHDAELALDAIIKDYTS